MKFEALDRQLRVFETAHDFCVLPGLFMVARIDGRNFTRLTKETHSFEAPFDIKFRDYMVATVKHLMNCGFRILYGYTQSDEISLLLHPDEDSFGRKLRKLNSILAGEASAQFSLLLGSLAVFDCRISQLPDLERVVDYFRWRNEDACRNALNAHCYWMLRKSGESPAAATEQLDRLSTGAKNELLFQQSQVNFNDLPNWQKRGIGLYWEQDVRQSVNPLTQTEVSAARKRLKVDLELPMKEDYSQFMRSLLLAHLPEQSLEPN